MNKEGFIELKAEAERLSITNGKKQTALTIIDGLIKKGPPLPKVVRLATTRAAVRQSVSAISERIAEINREMEPYYQNQIKDMVAQGIMTEDEAKPYLGKPAGPKHAKKINHAPKKYKEIAVYKELKPLPKLKIDKQTGEVTGIKGEKTVSLEINRNTSTHRILMVLAENPHQEVSRQIIEKILLEAGFHETHRRVIFRLRSKLKQLDKTFEFISHKFEAGRKSNSNYILNTDVELIDKKLTEEAESKGARNQEAAETEKISLDRETSKLTIGNKTVSLGKQELIVISYFVDHPEKQVLSSEISKILDDAGVKTSLGRLIAGIENKFDAKIFERTRVEGTRDFLWLLGLPKQPREKTENDNSYILTDQEVKIVMSLIKAKSCIELVLGNEVLTFNAPDWIMESEESILENSHDEEELYKQRKVTLEKIEKIIEEERRQGKSLQKSDEAGYLLLWLVGKHNFPEGLRTEHKAVTLKGFFNFLLESESLETTKTDHNLSVQEHQISFTVLPEHIINIEPEPVNDANKGEEATERPVAEILQEPSSQGPKPEKTVVF